VMRTKSGLSAVMAGSADEMVTAPGCRGRHARNAARGSGLNRRKSGPAASASFTNDHAASGCRRANSPITTPACRSFDGVDEAHVQASDLTQCSRHTRSRSVIIGAHAGAESEDCEASDTDTQVTPCGSAADRAKRSSIENQCRTRQAISSAA
jgi:hypothetical protein